MHTPRPPLLQIASVSELYQHFERLFLVGGGCFVSTCGHSIKAFDHHFFHMVKLDDPAKDKPLLMAGEKERILATTDGFGPYVYDKQRAIYLESAFICLTSPDEVWEDDALKSARWIYIKEFDASPYAFTILLIGERKSSRVPITSFPAKKRDAKKWRKGVRIYP
jgi:hypothetical protein